MQYLLTKEELDDLVPRAELLNAQVAIEWFHVTLIGDKCIHHPDFTGFGYCNEHCPIGKLREYRKREELCPKTKQWGK